jgi:SAM-dependent methyltransferase
LPRTPGSLLFRACLKELRVAVRPIHLSVVATYENFDERGYLAQNGDVAKAVKARGFASGRDHFVKTGRSEGRRQRVVVAIDEARRRKLEKLRPHLRHDMPFREEAGRLNFLTRQMRKETRIAETDNVSANPYDTHMVKLIETYGNGLILDCGAGRRDVYYENVLNYEIVPYDSTDVLGVGEHLPFESNTFDAVFSIAVLEHVRDPFRCAAEIARVLKKGGQLYCCIPFLQPLHGYPHHYFNATPQGARRLFEDLLHVDTVCVPQALHPIWSLHWMVKSWSEGLDAQTREAFLQMPIKELTAPPLSLLERPFASALPEAQRFELAAGTVLTASKEVADQRVSDLGAAAPERSGAAAWFRGIRRRFG